MCGLYAVGRKAIEQKHKSITRVGSWVSQTVGNRSFVDRLAPVERDTGGDS